MVCKKSLDTVEYQAGGSKAAVAGAKPDRRAEAGHLPDDAIMLTY